MSSSELNKQIGRNLRSAREGRGLTQRELATAAGMPQSTLNSYENAMRTTPVQQLVNLADKLEVSVQYLLGRGGSVDYEDGFSDGFAACKRKSAEVLRIHCTLPTEPGPAGAEGGSR